MCQGIIQSVHRDFTRISLFICHGIPADPTRLAHPILGLDPYVTHVVLFFPISSGLAILTLVALDHIVNQG